MTSNLYRYTKKTAIIIGFSGFFAMLSSGVASSPIQLSYGGSYGSCEGWREQYERWSSYFSEHPDVPDAGYMAEMNKAHLDRCLKDLKNPNATPSSESQGQIDLCEGQNNFVDSAPGIAKLLGMSKKDCHSGDSIYKSETPITGCESYTGSMYDDCINSELDKILGDVDDPCEGREWSDCLMGDYFPNIQRAKQGPIERPCTLENPISCYDDTGKERDPTKYGNFKPPSAIDSEDLYRKTSQALRDARNTVKCLNVLKGGDPSSCRPPSYLGSYTDWIRQNNREDSRKYLDWVKGDKQGDPPISREDLRYTCGIIIFGTWGPDPLNTRPSNCDELYRLGEYP